MPYYKISYARFDDQLLYCLRKDWEDTLTGLTVPNKKTDFFMLHVVPSK